MSATSRHDFFTLIHKGQRRDLFAATTLAGALDWSDPVEVREFTARWSTLCNMLEAHASHEDAYFLPLLAEHAPHVIADVSASHEELEHEMITVTDAIAIAVATRSRDHGLAVYRKITAFVARYLLHVLEEETVIMPAIWTHCTDDEIAAARASFLAAQTLKGVSRSRRAMLPAVTAHDRAALAHAARMSGPEAFTAFMTEAEEVLAAPDWQQLADNFSPSAVASN